MTLSLIIFPASVYNEPKGLGRFHNQADRCLTPTNSTHATRFLLKLNCQIKRRNCPLLITKNTIIRIPQIWNSSSVVFSSSCVTKTHSIKSKNEPHLNKQSLDFVRLNITHQILKIPKTSELSKLRG